MRNGEFVIVLDDEDRENEGDLIVAADKVTPEAIAFMVEYTSGVVCVGLPKRRCEELQLPLMVPTEENEESMYTAFTVTVDLRHEYGVTTGISASDRAKTIRALGDGSAKADKFRRPGHIFPLIAKDWGVLTRPGHTEAAVDLARLAGCEPAGVLCEVVDRSTGEMAKTQQLLELGAAHKLHCITIKDLLQHRIQHEILPAVAAEQDLSGRAQADASDASEADAALTRFCCPDGSEAAFATFGDVQSGPTEVHVLEVGHRLTEAAANRNGSAAQSVPEVAEALQASQKRTKPCAFVVASYPRAGGTFSSNQGGTLPGMSIAAVLAALQACKCSAAIHTSDARVLDALQAFGYYAAE